jgi:hypothetical protein
MLMRNLLRLRRKHSVVTYHPVRCPVRDRYATVAVQTNLRARFRDRHFAVATCSLLSEVTCSQPCLYILNGDVDTKKIRQGRCISGTMDCVDLAQAATRSTGSETPTMQSPWSYAG